MRLTTTLTPSTQAVRLSIYQITEVEPADGWRA